MEFIIPCGVLSHRNVRKPHCTTICCRGTSWAATESSLAPAGATLCKRRVKGTERRGCSGTLGPQSEQSAGDELWFSYIFIWKLGSKAERLACSCCDSMLFRLKLCCEVNANAYWLRLKFVISLLDSDDRNPAQSEGWSTLRRTCVFFFKFVNLGRSFGTCLTWASMDGPVGPQLCELSGQCPQLSYGQLSELPQQ